MMDLSKSYEFFQPEKVTERIHIIGCGSVGSTIAENLARCGLKKMTLWDFDKVESHNIVNQMFRQQDVGKTKVEALKDILLEINPDMELKLKPQGWNGEMLSGYVFLAVDSIEIRRKIVEQHLNSPTIKAMFDTRTLLTGAQLYAANWSEYKSKKDFLATMQFSHEEAAAETPVSACGVTLGVATTVRIAAALSVNNFIKFVKVGKIWKLVMFDGFNGIFDCFG